MQADRHPLAIGSFRASARLRDHEYIVRHTMGPHSFDIPYGYVIRRLLPEWVICPGDKLTFAFWIPDLRAPKAYIWFRYDFRLQEPDRQKPSPHEFIVVVSYVS